MAYRGRADKGMSAVNLKVEPSKKCSETCVEARFSSSGLFSLVQASQRNERRPQMLSSFFSLLPSLENRPVLLVDCTHYYPRPPVRRRAPPLAALGADAAKQLGANCLAKISLANVGFGTGNLFSESQHHANRIEIDDCFKNLILYAWRKLLRSVNVSDRTHDRAYSLSLIRNRVSRYDMVGTRSGGSVEWYRHSAPSTKRQCLCLDKLLIHSRATNGVLAVARDTKFAAPSTFAQLRLGSGRSPSG